MNEKGIISHIHHLAPDFDTSRVCIKIPATWEGLQACRVLEQQKKIATLATIVFSMEQVALAVDAGCRYIAPYVNELRVHFDATYTDANKDRAALFCGAAQRYCDEVASSSPATSAASAAAGSGSVANGSATSALSSAASAAASALNSAASSAAAALGSTTASATNGSTSTTDVPPTLPTPPPQQTQIMAASLTTIEEVMRLAGAVKHITVSPPLLTELEATPAAGWPGAGTVGAAAPTSYNTAGPGTNGDALRLKELVKDESQWRLAFTRAEAGESERKLCQAIGIFCDMQEQIERLVRGWDRGLTGKN